MSSQANKNISFADLVSEHELKNIISTLKSLHESVLNKKLLNFLSNNIRN